MTTLYAVCRTGGPLVVKHVQLANQVQQQVAAQFDAQATAFNHGINNEHDFDGDWKPDPDELLVARQLVEAQTLLQAAAQNAVALPVLDVLNFGTEGVKGLFVVTGQGAQRKLLLQAFSPQQILSGNKVLLHDGNVFRALQDPAFSLGSQLVATIDAQGDIRFKSFHMLRRIFDLSNFFQQATDADLQTFCGHASLSFGNANAFVADADETIRKSVHAITQADVLGQFNVAAIDARAQAIGFPITVTANRIEVPPGRRATKELLGFLLDRVYRGPLNQQLFITNSRRPL